MTKSIFRWAPVLVSALTVIPMAMSTTPAQAQARLFSTCSEIKKNIPAAHDGLYLLYNNGNLFTVFCYDMSANPREYINLPAITGANFSQYTAGGAAPGANVRTSFSKLRVDPATLTADIGDLTFATTTGRLDQGATAVTSMPYGVAMSCVAPGNAAGVGNIDLRNTRFQVDSTFAVGGYLPAGSATVSPNHQVVDLLGGGYCGWTTTAPALYNPFNPSDGMYDLKLSCATAPSDPDPGQVCIHGNPANVTEQARSGQGMTVLYHGRQVAVVNSDDQIRP